MCRRTREREAIWRVVGGIGNEGPAPMTKAIALVALLGLVACETIQGAGRDLETAGEVIQDEAQEVQSEM